MDGADRLNGGKTTGILSYLAHSVASSLYRNGKVYSRRDLDGSDHDCTGWHVDKQTVPVGNGRLLPENRKKNVETHGFELLHRPPDNPSLDFYDHQQVVQTYYPECAEIVKEITKAHETFAFDHNIRSVSGKENSKKITGGQGVQQPIHGVHGDYTLTSAPQRLRDLANPPGMNDTLRSILPPGRPLLDKESVESIIKQKKRFAIINLWRNIDDRPVAADPLALCDGQSVEPEDLVVFEIRYHDRTGENYFAKHRNEHEWWYYPAMTRDEVLLIKQWDSAGGLARSDGRFSDGSAQNQDAPCTFSFHSAFVPAETPEDAADRQSIEVRCVVLYG